jgi:hypothetical protein
MAVAFTLNGGGLYTFSWVSKSMPKNGITIVKDTNENKTLNILNRILSSANGK